MFNPTNQMEISVQNKEIILTIIILLKPSSQIEQKYKGTMDEIGIIIITLYITIKKNL